MSVHFLLAQKTNQKRAASDLFWDYHFLGCSRITTRRLRQMAEPPQTVMLTFRPSLRSLKNANLFPKRSDGIDRLTAIGLTFQFRVFMQKFVCKKLLTTALKEPNMNNPWHSQG
jgi:hypothetical protein